MQRVTITLSDDLMHDIDRVIADRGYQNRSEAIRDLVRTGLMQSAIDTGASGECVGVLSYVFDHAARDLARRLTNSFHHNHHLAVSSLHVHLDRSNCLEVSVLKGPLATVRHFAEHVIAERSVRDGQLAIIPMERLTPPAGAGDAPE